MSLVLNVEILGEYKKLASATKGAEGTLDKLQRKFKTVGTNIAKVAGGIGIGLAAGLASQIKPAIDAASDLAESTNAVEVAFGDAADEILALGDNAARGLGLSKTELFGISTQFSSFAKTIAGDSGDVVGVIDELSTRGADFASVFNLEVGDALGKFQSGLAGQSEPLRNFGIDMSAARVEQYLLENGLWDGTTALTEQDKVMGRYGTLMEQTSITQGDFTNTSDGLANQQRITKAEFENLRAEIGEKFLPILNNVMGFILDDLIPAIEDFWEELTDPSGEAMLQIGAVGDAWDAFVGTFKTGSTEIQSQDVFKWLGDSMVSTIKMMTHLGTFASEIFEGMSKIFQAGFGVGPLSQALRGAGIAQVAGAMSAANRAAAEIKFADETAAYYVPAAEQSDRRFNNMIPEQRFDQFGQPITININVNRANVDGEQLINEINDTLRSQGSNVILR